MSASGDILAAVRTAIAVDGASYDLSGTGRVQIGMFSGPPIGGSFVSIHEGDVSTIEAPDLSRWSYRATLVIEGWAEADSDEQADRIAAAQALRSDILAALHGAFIDPSSRAAAMRAVAARDVQASATVVAGELVDVAWAGWGYVVVQIAYTADGDPGAY